MEILMHVVREVSSRRARAEWREILDTVMTGDSDIVISRYGKEVAVLIPAEDYRALESELEELRMTRVAEDIYEAYLADRSAAVQYTEVREELLDEETSDE
jgi:prevent-host-death family protein